MYKATKGYPIYSDEIMIYVTFLKDQKFVKEQGKSRRMQSYIHKGSEYSSGWELYSFVLTE